MPAVPSFLDEGEKENNMSEDILMKNIGLKLEKGISLSEMERIQLCNEMMTTEKNMENLILKYFTDEEFWIIMSKRIGTGVIGGKACGMLMARKLIRANLPEYNKWILPPESWFLGSDVFIHYMKENDCLNLRENQYRKKEKFEQNEELYRRLRNGRFGDEIKMAFTEILERNTDMPLVVRSSSCLEDSFNGAFSGKYESVFCMNQGSMQERLAELEEAVRQVYASTQNESALEYRRVRRLLGYDERMAVIIQRVEGKRRGDYYMPLAAGMGCSYNPYKWMEEMNPDAGMLRIVAGLGTRAVQRTPGDYPRLIGLDRAKGNIYTTTAERHKFSQRNIDVLNLADGKKQSIRSEKIEHLLSKQEKRLLYSRDYDAESLFMERGEYRQVTFVDCQGIAFSDTYIKMMRRLLRMLEQEYCCPVDIEFALECGDDGNPLMNIFQCRPMKYGSSQRVVMPVNVDHELLFDVRRTSMLRSKEEKIDIIVWVDPQKYYEYPYSKKADVSHMINCINKYFGSKGMKMMLLVPGRIGTSSPELGVPVTYADISQFAAICEVAYSKVGYNPTLSYGSHMFQDLVEADVYYGAINENSKTRIYQPEILNRFEEIFKDIWPDKNELAEIIKVYNVKNVFAKLILDAKEGRAVFQIKKRD